MDDEHNKYEHKILLAQVIIAVLTFIVTPLTTWFVVDKQLSGQHKYWNIEQDRLKDDRLYQQKMKIYEETAGLVNRLNNQVLAFQIYSENKDVTKIISDLLKKSNKAESTDYFNEYVKNREKASEALFNSFELASSLHQQQAISFVTFGEEINPFFVNYFRKIEQLEFPFLPTERIRTIILESWSRNKKPEEAIKSVSKISEGLGLSEQKKAINNSALLLEYMFKHLSLEIGCQQNMTIKK
jgi:hypothetical protein